MKTALATRNKAQSLQKLIRHAETDLVPKSSKHMKTLVKKSHFLAAYALK